MKKAIIKIAVFIATFVIATFLIGKIMNKGHDNLTVEMGKASFPLISMTYEGKKYNQLYGYANPMDVSYQREVITILGENRDTDFEIDTFGRRVRGIQIKVRNLNGSRLIEDSEITDYVIDENLVRGRISLKDLIDKDTEYSLAITLELEGEKQVYYYSKIIWSDQLHYREKMEFVLDFHERLYDREAARALTKYLETNAKLEDNSSFHKVNIHSSFRQITWGDLAVEEMGDPVLTLVDISNQTASFLINYVISSSNNKSKDYYFVKEYFRVRYTAERMYLLDYERTTNQMPNEGNMYANDKIILGITDTAVDMLESEDGNVVVFEAANRLFAYDSVTNKLTVVFGFYDGENTDWRTLNMHNSIKILDADEGGNVQFAVYGYMSRGRHEGEVGIQIYSYSSVTNTIEELIYIPFDKTNSVLETEMDQLLYLNRNGKLYIQLSNHVFTIDLENKTYQNLFAIPKAGSLLASDNHRIMVWTQGDDVYSSSIMNIVNLNEESTSPVVVSSEETIMPLGFIEEDVIYGVAKKEDLVKENSGKTFFPMYKICICDSAGTLLKEYLQPGIYITGCTVEDNQISLSRLERKESGEYQETYQDHIMNNTLVDDSKNKIVAADIDIYERFVQIQTKKVIDTKTIQVLNPKEIVFEEGRTLELDYATDETDRYYVYGPDGVCGIYSSPAIALNQAYNIAGSVVNGDGDLIWKKAARVSKNQIMAIKADKADENRSSLAVCLDTIFKFEGLVRNSEYLLSKGDSCIDVLSDNLEDAYVLDFSGDTLDAMLYYVNQDIPVLALLNNGDAVLVTGFNEFNIVIMNPTTGELYKKGMNDSREWFEENGNRFITYVRSTNQ